MSEKKRTKNLETIKTFNTDLIFSRVVYLLSMDRLDFSSLFNYELAPVPNSLFKDTGDARYTSTISVLNNKLKVEVSSRTLEHDVVVIDRCGMLHPSVYWPKKGLVEDLVNSVDYYLSKFIIVADVYLIFDRYFENSIKSDTRLERIRTYKRSHKFAIRTPLPPKEICMSSRKTKENLIEIIAPKLMERLTGKKIETKLVITSKDEFPEET